MATSADRTPPTMRLPYQAVQRAHVASVDHRLMNRWDCPIGTAKARRERAIADIVVVVEECIACGDTDRLGHLMSLLDTARPVVKSGSIHDANHADAAEDVLQAAYQRNPCKQTARAWFDSLGLEGRANEPAMAELREQWDL